MYSRWLRHAALAALLGAGTLSYVCLPSEAAAPTIPVRVVTQVKGGILEISVTWASEASPIFKSEYSSGSARITIDGASLKGSTQVVPLEGDNAKEALISQVDDDTVVVNIRAANEPNIKVFQIPAVKNIQGVKYILPINLLSAKPEATPKADANKAAAAPKADASKAAAATKADANKAATATKADASKPAAAPKADANKAATATKADANKAAAATKADANKPAAAPKADANKAAAAPKADANKAAAATKADASKAAATPKADANKTAAAPKADANKAAAATKADASKPAAAPKADANKAAAAPKADANKAASATKADANKAATATKADASKPAAAPKADANKAATATKADANKAAAATKADANKPAAAPKADANKAAAAPKADANKAAAATKADASKAAATPKADANKPATATKIDNGRKAETKPEPAQLTDKDDPVKLKVIFNPKADELRIGLIYKGNLKNVVKRAASRNSAMTIELCPAILQGPTQAAKLDKGQIISYQAKQAAANKVIIEVKVQNPPYFVQDVDVNGGAFYAISYNYAQDYKPTAAAPKADASKAATAPKADASKAAAAPKADASKAAAAPKADANKAAAAPKADANKAATAPKADASKAAAAPKADASKAATAPKADASKADATPKAATVPPAETSAVKEKAALVKDHYAYFPLKERSAAAVADSLIKLYPNVDFKVDEMLNVIFVQGSAEDVAKIGNVLKVVSNFEK